MITRQFWWPAMDVVIESFVQMSSTCQLSMVRTPSSSWLSLNFNSYDQACVPMSMYI